MHPCTAASRCDPNGMQQLSTTTGAYQARTTGAQAARTTGPQRARTCGTRQATPDPHGMIIGWR